MILVLLGTQDKDFSRLLKAIDNEIEAGTITDQVIAQKGFTKYKSKHMEMIDFMSYPELEKLIKKASLIITHGGVGTILTAIKQKKKIIAAPRLVKYGEHHNNHQEQIINEFAKKGYILALNDFDKLKEVINSSTTFKPKEFKSNTKNLVKKLDGYVKITNHISWYNKYSQMLWYVFFGFCTTVLNVLIFIVLRKLKASLLISNTIAWVVAVFFAFIVDKIYVFKSKYKNLLETIKEGLSFYGIRIISYLFDMISLTLLIDTLKQSEILSKIIVNIFVIIMNFLFSKFIIFRKRSNQNE